MKTINLTLKEVELLIEALLARAARHESMSRAKPQSAGPHDRAAAAMRKLANEKLKGGSNTMSTGNT